MIIRRDTITTREVRSKLREPNNREDDLFISFCVSLGALNPSFKSDQPGEVKRVTGQDPKPKFGTRMHGQGNTSKNKYKEDLKIDRILPEKQFNPMNKSDISSGTKLGKGIPLGRFVATQSLSQATLNDIPSLAERQDLARHYYMYAYMMQAFQNSRDKFSQNYSLNVTEGFYLPETTETITANGIKDLAAKGRAVVFEVTDQEGNVAPEKTYEFAVYLKDNHLFDKLILSYDTVDPNTNFNVQVVVTMPEIDSSFKGSFKRQVQTEYNYNLLVDNALAECIA